MVSRNACQISTSNTNSFGKHSHPTNPWTFCEFRNFLPVLCKSPTDTVGVRTAINSHHPSLYHLMALQLLRPFNFSGYIDTWRTNVTWQLFT